MSVDSKDRNRDRYYQRYYGITLADYEELLKKQKESCACCGKHVSSFPRRLSVDHDHTTGEIRGLLCFSCNHLLIGRFSDAVLFTKAGKYLTGPHTGYFVPKEYLKGMKKKRRRKKKNV